MILQNYIFKNILITSINVTIILLSMVWLVQSLRQIDLIIENGASLFDFMYISILPGPLWIMMIIPMSTLFSVLLIFNKFTNDKEKLMFQLSGASIFQIIKPIFLLSQIFWKKGDENIIDAYGPNGISKLISITSFYLSRFQSGYLFQISLFAFSKLII